MFKANKIIVCSPVQVTGGPELLHQLVVRLRKNNWDAYISYYPFKSNLKKPYQFLKYDTPSIIFEDVCDNYIIVPESATWILKKIKKSRVAVWWLSVDNYFGYHQSFIIAAYYRCWTLLKGRKFVWQMKKVDHYVQSYYANLFLARNGIGSTILSDCLNHSFLEIEVDVKNKKNIVAYNPCKGRKEVNALQCRYPNIKFESIESMTTIEVIALLSRAKIYVDFGHHPGKDRLPREAAMAMCCVITGRKGAAENDHDIRIPEKYKLDDSSGQFIIDFKEVTDDIFNNYEIIKNDFNDYREYILQEPKQFFYQIDNIFGRNGQD